MQQHHGVSSRKRVPRVRQDQPEERRARRVRRRNAPGRRHACERAHDPHLPVSQAIPHPLLRHGRGLSYDRSPVRDLRHDGPVPRAYRQGPAKRRHAEGVLRGALQAVRRRRDRLPQHEHGPRLPRDRRHRDVRDQHQAALRGVRRAVRRRVVGEEGARRDHQEATEDERVAPGRHERTLRRAASDQDRPPEPRPAEEGPSDVPRGSTSGAHTCCLRVSVSGRSTTSSVRHRTTCAR